MLHVFTSRRVVIPEGFALATPVAFILEICF